jgi:hypothetical protein
MDKINKNHLIIVGVGLAALYWYYNKYKQQQQSAAITAQLSALSSAGIPTGGDNPSAIPNMSGVMN